MGDGRPPSFADVFHTTQHRQAACILALLSWVASCDGQVAPPEQALLDKLADAVDDPDELATIEAAMRFAQPKDLELACRHLKKDLDRGGKRLLVQLAITVAVQDGRLTVGENHVLQFLSDLMGLSPRAFGRLFEQIAHRPFPRAGDPGAPAWWQARESGRSPDVEPLPLDAMGGGEGGRDGSDAAEAGGGGAMTRRTALSVMGLDDGATADAVHAAYRRLAKTRHPDRFAPLGPAAAAAAAEAFKRLHDAYAVLST